MLSSRAIMEFQKRQIKFFKLTEVADFIKRWHWRNVLNLWKEQNLFFHDFSWFYNVLQLRGNLNITPFFSRVTLKDCFFYNMYKTLTPYWYSRNTPHKSDLLFTAMLIWGFSEMIVQYKVETWIHLIHFSSFKIIYLNDCNSLRRFHCSKSSV